MLKQIRKGAIENPWFFRMIMLGIAVVFAVSMGWWGFGDNESTANTLAQIGEDRITSKEYQRAYQSASRLYRELFQGDYDDKALRKRVIDELVERKLWAQEAKRMRLAVSDAALKDSVINLPGFQNEGKFDPETYQRMLAAERFTPEGFEAVQRELLLVRKVQLLVRDGVSLTPTELKEAEENNPESPEPARTIEQRLSQKQERAVRAYIISLKEKTPIVVKEELL